MIETRALRHRYAGGPWLTFADVDVPQGGVLIVAGPSGSGKSTWLAVAAGLLRPTHGDATVAGQALGELPGPARDAWRARSVGFLPQRLHLSPALDVRGNLALAFFAAGLREDAAAIGHALGALGVADLAARKPQHLSGGQAQRVALARATLLSPRVILADEPTASLDDNAAQGALALLQSCAQRSGATLVIATHDRRIKNALQGAFLYEIGPQPGFGGREQL